MKSLPDFGITRQSGNQEIRHNSLCELAFKLYVWLCALSVKVMLKTIRQAINSNQLTDYQLNKMLYFLLVIRHVLSAIRQPYQ